MTDKVEAPGHVQAPGVTVAGVVSYLSAASATAWAMFVAQITSWPKVAGVAILALAGLAYMGKISAPSVPYVASKSDIASLRTEMTQVSGKATAAGAWYGAMRDELEEIRGRVESLEAAKVQKPIAKKPIYRPAYKPRPIETQ